MNSKQRIAAGAALLALGVGVSVYLAVWRPLATRGKQLHSLVQMEALERQLHEFHGRQHRFPKILAELASQDEPAVDYFGNQFLYVSDSTGFLLIGLGADGRPDGTNYLAVRESGERVAGDCVDPRTDLIVSDRRWHRRCGK